jgi:hypothetical protein
MSGENRIRICIISKEYENSNSSSKDDIILITPSDNNINVTYKTPGHTSQEVVFTNSSTFSYIKSVIDLLLLDNDPFHAIQLEFPVYPAIFICLYSIRHDKKKILKAIREACLKTEDAWFHHLAEPLLYSCTDIDSDSDTDSDSGDSSSS